MSENKITRTVSETHILATDPLPPYTPCQHEQPSTSHTGDGVEVVTCLECGKQLHVGKMPWPDDETPASVVTDDEVERR